MSCGCKKSRCHTKCHCRKCCKKKYYKKVCHHVPYYKTKCKDYHYNHGKHHRHDESSSAGYSYDDSYGGYHHGMHVDYESSRY